MLIGFVILYLVVSSLTVPAANPIAALLSILPRDETGSAPVSLPFGSIPFFSLSVIISLLAGFLLAGTVLFSLAEMRKREQGKHGAR